VTDVPMPKITCHGKDGSVWRYYAFYGPDLAPEETGWVLVVDGVPELRDAQRLTAGEVIGDVETMVDDPVLAHEIVRLESRAMLQALQSRRLSRDPARRIALVLRTAELRRDYDALSDPGSGPRHP
jgi:hypothetical protein